MLGHIGTRHLEILLHIHAFSVYQISTKQTQHRSWSTTDFREQWSHTGRCCSVFSVTQRRRGTIADISSPKRVQTGVPSPDEKWKERAVLGFYPGAPLHDRHRDLCPVSQRRHVAIVVHIWETKDLTQNELARIRNNTFQQDRGAGPAHQGTFSEHFKLKTETLLILNSGKYKFLSMDFF